jgi:multicomponent Na+:H+ antiporter subunit B
VNSLILQTATRMLMPLLLLFSVVILMRGHSEPGGGFVGGLIVAASFCLYGMAYGPDKLKQLLPLSLQSFIGCGLLLAFASGLPGLLLGGSFMEAQWASVPVPGLGEKPLHVGTPVFFDIGVYAVVIGVVTLFFQSLAER